jgi:8-oxo-dGTP pyrophosphatase MutT (NUDIX family)
MAEAAVARSRSRISDPRAVPYEVAHDDLPALQPHKLSPQDWREIFASQRTWKPELGGDRASWVEGPVRDAAVLLALTRRGGVLLTQRTTGLRHHAGQVAFPGGMVEASDATAATAALREAHEEIGLGPDRVEVLGELPDYLTGSGFRIRPVVGLLRNPLDLHEHLRPDPREVAAVFETPLAFIFDPGNHRRHHWLADEGPRTFYSMPWDCADPCHSITLDKADSPMAGWGRAPRVAGSRQFMIWGATAAVLRNFYHLLYAHRELIDPAR